MTRPVAFDGADADAGVVGVGEADAARAGSRSGGTRWRASVDLGDGGELGVGRDDGDLELDRVAGDFGEADVGAEAVGFFDLQDLQRAGADAGGFVAA